MSMELTEEEKFLFKMANAKPLGVYCEVEVSPIDPDYGCESRAATWECEATTHDVDEVIEWLLEHHEENETALKLLNKYDTLATESKKWDFIEDLELFHSELIPDELSFYYYTMQYKLVGVCFTMNQAIEIKKSIDPIYRPYIESLSKYEIKGYSELSEVAQYFKKKAEDTFK